MNVNEFREKYFPSVTDEKILEYLDFVFSLYISDENKDFRISQIKLKFGMTRIYSNVPFDLQLSWEKECNSLLALKK